MGRSALSGWDGDQFDLGRGCEQGWIDGSCDCEWRDGAGGCGCRQGDDDCGCDYGWNYGAVGHKTATKVATTTVLTITSPLTIPFGQPVHGTAQVTANDGSAVTGTISFFDGTTNLCTIAVALSASCPAGSGAGFAVGTHVLTAVYSGDDSHLGSTSAAVTVVVLGSREGADGDDADFEP